MKKDRFLLGGEIPSATALPPGCFLHGRCPIGDAGCGTTRVPLHPYTASHHVACLKVPWPAARAEAPMTRRSGK